ncbi:MAG TPA: hypothetical protein VH062_14255 [Polyangiaceae bacterium]|jgi:hypothetical protein|nr:hypothetical protein [Polyangiaceae bacterium]
MIVIGFGAAGCGASTDAPETASGDQKATPAAAETVQAELEANNYSVALANKSADESLHLITRVKTPSGGIIEFYEPVAGDVLVSEAGDEHSVPTKGLSGKLPTEIYRMVAPTLPIPAALAAAEQRALAAGAVVHEQVDLTPPKDVRITAPAELPAQSPSSAQTPSTGPDGVQVRRGVTPEDTFCSMSWLKANDPSGWVYADCGSFGALSYTWCYADTGPGAWAKGSNLTGDNAIACVESGSNIVMTVSRTNGDTSGTWSIPAPGWRWYQHTDRSRYSLNSSVSGSWGDIQYVGGFYTN